METKKISFWWAVPIGLLFPILQIAIYFARFGEMNPYAPVFDYLWFALAGIAGGLLLTFLLGRSTTGLQRWFVGIAFLLAAPISTLMMVGGAVLGPLGIILFPALNWGLFCGFGFLAGRFFSRKLAGTA